MFTAVDTRLLLAIYNHANNFLTTFFTFITHFGDPLVLWPATFVICTYLIRKDRYKRAGLLFVLLAGSGVLVSLIKELVARPRPQLWSYGVYEPTFSFPSGHAATSMILACSLTYLGWSQARLRLPLLITSVTYVLIIGLSRLYLGVHYPSDVIGGWILAAGWFAGWTFLYHRFVDRSEAEPGE